MPTDVPTLANDFTENVLRKIRFICERIIGGIEATRRWSVYFLYAHKVLSVVLATLGAAGIYALQLNANENKAFGWAGLISLLLAIILGLYKEFGIEKSAQMALSAHEAFSQLRTRLITALNGDDPVTEVNAIFSDAGTLWKNFHMVIHDPRREAAQLLYDELTAEYQSGRRNFPVAAARTRQRGR